LGPGPGEVGQGGQKVLHLWHHSQKIHTPNQKNFIVQTTRLAKSFELLTGSAALIGPEKFSIQLFLHKPLQLTRVQNC